MHLERTRAARLATSALVVLVSVVTLGVPASAQSAQPSAAAAPPAAGGSLDGTWTVDPSLGSFDYAAHAPLVGVGGVRGRSGESGSLAAWARFWSRWMSVACVAGYRDVTAGAPFLPPDDAGWSVLLEALLIAKVAYELRYELGSRPDWLGIPLVGFRDLVAGA